MFARPPQPSQPAKWVLEVETVDSSNWGPAKSLLSMTGARVVLLQEHHMPPDRCDEARVWCRKRGWKSLFSPPQQRQRRQLQCGGGNPRALDCGTARTCHPALRRWNCAWSLCCWHSHTVGRCGNCSGLLFSTQGLEECNLRWFSVVCQFASATTTDVMVGGDFQAEPALAQNLECFTVAGLCIDWFVMSASIGAAV